MHSDIEWRSLEVSVHQRDDVSFMNGVLEGFGNEIAIDGLKDNLADVDTGAE